jgi:hypothetical protein
VNIESPDPDAEILDELAGELTIPSSDLIVAYRRGARRVQTHEPTGSTRPTPARRRSGRVGSA